MSNRLAIILYYFHFKKYPQYTHTHTQTHPRSYYDVQIEQGEKGQNDLKWKETCFTQLLTFSISYQAEAKGTLNHKVNSHSVNKKKIIKKLKMTSKT